MERKKCALFVLSTLDNSAHNVYNNMGVVYNELLL